jgi:hypothetical protein
MPDASAVIIILPVVRIERAPDAPSSVKTKAPSKSTRSTAKSASKKTAAGTRAVMIEPAAKSASPRKRRKRVVTELPSPACGGR